MHSLRNWHGLLISFPNEAPELVLFERSHHRVCQFSLEPTGFRRTLLHVVFFFLKILAVTN